MQHEIQIEVRYYETDGQGIVHHANYFPYFELARVKMLQAAGFDYAELEQEGVFLVVHSIGCRYLLPAHFGDTLRVVTTVDRATPARIDHSYRVLRDENALGRGEQYSRVRRWRWHCQENARLHCQPPSAEVAAGILGESGSQAPAWEPIPVYL